MIITTTSLKRRKRNVQISYMHILINIINKDIIFFEENLINVRINIEDSALSHIISQMDNSKAKSEKIKIKKKQKSILPKGPRVFLLLISPKYIGITEYVIPQPTPAINLPM